MVERIRYGPNTVLDQVEARQQVWNPETLAFQPAQVQTSEIADPTLGYKISDIDESTATKYYGYLDKDGNWYIMAVTATAITYAWGDADYTDYWDARADLVYGRFNVAWGITQELPGGE